MTNVTLSNVRVVATMGVLLLTAATVSAQTAGETESLRGISSLAVVVEDISPAAGVTRATVKSRIELQLRRAGIPVATASVTGADVYVNVTARTLFNNFTVANVLVSVDQTVTLRASGQTHYGAQTWLLGGMLGAIPRDIGAMILDQIDDYVVQLINDYLTVNPPGR